MEEEAAFTSSNASQDSDDNEVLLPEERLAQPENNLVQFLIAQSPQLMQQPMNQRLVVSDNVLQISQAAANQNLMQTLPEEPFN